jgi:hypothetical protein
VGPTASDVDHLVTVVLVGLVERFGDADGAFGLVDGSPERRAAVGATSQCSWTLDRHDTSDDGVAGLLDRLADDDPASPRVLVIDDVGALRRRAEALGLGARLDGALARSDTSVVAVGRSVDDLGTLSDREGSTVLVAGGGRSRELSSGALMQLATFTEDPLATLRARLGTTGGAA